MEKEQKHGMAGEPVKLTETADRVEADLLVAALMESGIPAYKSSLLSGGVMNAYMGFSIYGAEVFVGEHDLERASLLLEELTLISEEDWETEEEELADDYDQENEAGVLTLRILILAGIGLFACYLLLKLIMLIYILIRLG